MTDKKNLHQRLAAVMGQVSYIQKEKKTGMNYTITSHDKVTALVRPVLLEHGIVYYPVRCEHVHNGNRAECSLTVRFVNIDDPADHIDVPTFGYGIDPQDKGPGKAISYAVKYALLKALGLETGDDPETDSIPHTPDDPAQQKRDAPAGKPERQKEPERRQPEQQPLPETEARDRLKAAIAKSADAAALSRLWTHDKTAEAMANMHPAMQAEVTKAYNARRDALAVNLPPGFEREAAA